MLYPRFVQTFVCSLYRAGITEQIFKLKFALRKLTLFTPVYVSPFLKNWLYPFSNFPQRVLDLVKLSLSPFAIHTVIVHSVFCIANTQTKRPHRL